MALVNDSQEKMKIPKMHKVLILTYYHPVIDRLPILQLLNFFYSVFESTVVELFYSEIIVNVGSC